MYKISKKEYSRLRDRAKKAQRIDQSEVCGALISSKNEFLRLEFLKNYSANGCSFEISVDEVKKLRKSLMNKSEKVVGLFHSHPISEAIPSKRDIDESPLNRLMLIYDVCGLEARLYRIIGNKTNKKPKILDLQIC